MSDEMQMQEQVRETARATVPRQAKAASKLALSKTTLRQLSMKEPACPVASSPNCGHSLERCWL